MGMVDATLYTAQWTQNNSHPTECDSWCGLGMLRQKIYLKEVIPTIFGISQILINIVADNVCSQQCTLKNATCDMEIFGVIRLLEI